MNEQYSDQHCTFYPLAYIIRPTLSIHSPASSIISAFLYIYAHIIIEIMIIVLKRSTGSHRAARLQHYPLYLIDIAKSLLSSFTEHLKTNG